MRVVLIVVVLAALVIAGITATLIQKYLSGQSGEVTVAEQVMLPRVLVATADLPAGTIIASGNFTWADWPEENLNPDYMVEDKKADVDADVMKTVEGKVLRRGVTKGEPLLATRLFTPGEGSHMAGLLKPGMRAFTLAVNRAEVAAGTVTQFIVPGDIVDLYLNVRRDVRNEAGQTVRHLFGEPIITYARVLAVDASTDDLAAGVIHPLSITLEVSPKQIEVLITAAQMGYLHFALHSLAKPDEPLYVGNFTASFELSRALGGAGKYRDTRDTFGAVESSQGTGQGTGRRSTVTVHRRAKSEELEFQEPGQR